jgi:hypothetical protein
LIMMLVVLGALVAFIRVRTHTETPRRTMGEGLRVRSARAKSGSAQPASMRWERVLGRCCWVDGIVGGRPPATPAPPAPAPKAPAPPPAPPAPPPPLGLPRNALRHAHTHDDQRQTTNDDGQSAADKARRPWIDKRLRGVKCPNDATGGTIGLVRQKRRQHRREGRGARGRGRGRGQGQGQGQGRRSQRNPRVTPTGRRSRTHPS